MYVYSEVFTFSPIPQQAASLGLFQDRDVKRGQFDQVGCACIRVNTFVETRRTITFKSIPARANAIVTDYTISFRCHELHVGTICVSRDIM
jgi:hypothetical protein